MAYLLDIQTVCISDLRNQSTTATVIHDCPIKELKLDSEGSKLLYRDKQKGLYLFDIANEERFTMLNFCKFFDWVPNTDVIVAQGSQDISIWYSSNSIDKKEQIPVKGDAIRLV